MKFKDILLISLSIIFFHINSIAFAADGMVLPQKPATAEKSQAKVTEKLPTVKRVQEKEENIAAPTGAAKPVGIKKPEKPTKLLSLSNLIMRAIKALALVLLLIFLLAGSILLYRRLKSGLAVKKEKAVSGKEPSSEPTTVSEAVASFVKHRLRR